MATQFGTVTLNKIIPSEPHSLAIELIDFADKTRQVRENGLTELQIESLVNSKPKNWQPIVVQETSTNVFCIISGFHRYEAAVRLDLKEIMVQTIPPDVSLQDARLLAYQQNSEHGLPLTREEKRAYAVEIWLATGKSLPAAKIALLAHISDKTVTEAVNQWCEENGESSPFIQREREKQETEETTEEGDGEEKTGGDAFKQFANAVRKFYNATDTTSEDEASIAESIANAFSLKQKDIKNSKGEINAARSAGDDHVMAWFRDRINEAYTLKHAETKKPTRKAKKETSQQAATASEPATAS